MAQSNVASELAEFADIVKQKEPLAPYTLFKIGGPAEVMVQPRTVPELAAVVQRCYAKKLPLRILGAGCSVLVHDEGVHGVVLRLNGPRRSLIKNASVSDFILARSPSQALIIRSSSPRSGCVVDRPCFSRATCSTRLSTST